MEANVLSKEEYEQRLERAEKLLDEEWTIHHEKCPFEDCEFKPSKTEDFADKMDEHLTFRHPDYCIACQVSLLFVGCHAKIDNGNPLTKYVFFI